MKQMLEAKVFEDIYTMDKYHNFVTIPEEMKSGTWQLTVSRERDVTIRIKDLIELKEGLYSFFYNPEEDIYEPVNILNGDIYWCRIKGRVLNGIDVHIPRTSIIQPIIDRDDPKYKEAIALLFGDDININNYDFKLSGTRQGTVKTRRTKLTSLNVERAIPLPEPLTRLTEDERFEYNQRERFLSIIYKSGDDIRLVDIGELIDEDLIDFKDLQDIFLSNQKLRNDNQKFVVKESLLENHQTFTRNKDGSKRPVDSAKLTQFLAETLSIENGKDVIITGTNVINKPWKDMTPTERVTSVKEQFPLFSELEDGSFAVLYDVMGMTHLIVNIDMSLPTSMQDSYVYRNHFTALADLNGLETGTDEPNQYDSFCPALDLNRYKSPTPK